MGLLGSNLHIRSSPFSRCLKTAEITKKILEIGTEICLDVALRERWFGIFEGIHTGNYSQVWERDRIDPSHKTFGVESVQEVKDRMWGSVMDCESQYTNETFLFVSHGDPLQILLTAFRNDSPAMHRCLPEFQLGEIRRLL